jgi:hypothetical protein
MANARLLATNLAWASGASVAASAAATGYPASNLLSPKRTQVWRSSTTTGDQTVTSTLASALAITAIALVNWKKHGTAGTIKVETKNGGGAYAAFGGGSGLFTLPASNRTRLVILFGSATATDVRITFTNVGAVSDYVELGVLFVSAYVEPSTNIADALTYTVVDPSVVKRTEGGQRQTWSRTKYLTLASSWSYLSAADKDALLAIYDLVGVGTPIVFALVPANADQIAYGYLQTAGAKHEVIDQWTYGPAFEEAL